MQYLWKLTLADRRWMLPVWSFVPYALCPWRSIKLVALITVELDFTPNRVMGLLWTILSIVNVVWWITYFWRVYCKSYLDGSNYNHHKSQKRFCHWIGKANGVSIADEDECLLFRGLYSQCSSQYKNVGILNAWLSIISLLQFCESQSLNRLPHLLLL